jgi:hypothetical protein
MPYNPKYLFSFYRRLPEDFAIKAPFFCDKRVRFPGAPHHNTMTQWMAVAGTIIILLISLYYLFLCGIYRKGFVEDSPESAIKATKAPLLSLLSHFYRRGRRSTATCGGAAVVIAGTTAARRSSKGLWAKKHACRTVSRRG